MKLNPMDSTNVESSESADPSVAILKASLALASSIGAEAIVEGVETVAQFHLLKDMGYKLFQGYYFSRPIEFSDYCALLDNQADKSSLFAAPPGD